MSEYHVDALLSNLKQLKGVHIRVGEADTTTHPYFSRKMHRLLKEIGINSTYEGKFTDVMFLLICCNF